MLSHMKDVKQVVARQPPDLVLHAVDGEQVLGHSVLLSLHSHLMAEIIAGMGNEGRIGITVEASAKEIRTDIEMLENEQFELVDDDEIAALLGISGQNKFDDLDIIEELQPAIDLVNKDTSDCTPYKSVENMSLGEDRGTKSQNPDEENEHLSQKLVREETIVENTKQESCRIQKPGLKNFTCEEFDEHEIDQNEVDESYNTGQHSNKGKCVEINGGFWRYSSNRLDSGDPEIQNPEDLKKFILKEPVTSLYVCGICSNLRHKVLSNVRAHIESKHYSHMFTYECKYCDKTFNTKTGFTKHKPKCLYKCNKNY